MAWLPHTQCATDYGTSLIEFSNLILALAREGSWIKDVTTTQMGDDGGMFRYNVALLNQSRDL